MQNDTKNQERQNDKRRFIPAVILILVCALLSSCFKSAKLPHNPQSVEEIYANLLKTLTPQPIQEPVNISIKTTSGVINDPPDSKASAVGMPDDQVPLLFLHSGLPVSLVDTLDLENWELTNEENLAAAKILISGFDPSENNSDHTRWIYSVNVPFYSVIDGISFTDLEGLWHGNLSDVEGISKIYLTEPTRQAITTLLGTPDQSIVEPVSPDVLADLYEGREKIIVVLPFENTDLHWKILKIDDQSPLNDDFDVNNYPLSLHIWTEGEYPFTLPRDNYDPEKRTTLAMTGVTALTRATAYQMEIQGINFPGRDIVRWLSSTDLTHISNEVPFAENCPSPNPVQDDLTFCSSPDYIALLDFIGADIIELTGNHLLDYGTDAINMTLQMYKERSWLTYGGGWNLSDARSQARVEHNGNRLAFIGCNLPGPPNNFAGYDRPGSAACGDYSWLIDEITLALKDHYLPIVTVQYIEDYTAYPSLQMEMDFKRLVEAGAIAVFGSQAHTPKIMSFHQGAFIHFGLGNLFFDQMEVYYSDTLMPNTRDEFIDRLVFYDGRLISVELMTALLEDYARPRPMSLSERQDFLGRIFSGFTD